MQDCICINDTYSKDVLDFWAQYGVKYPLKDKVYEISEVVRHTNGSVGVRVSSITNPAIPVKHSVLGTAMIVPTFKISRFTTLQGDVITKEMLENVDVNV